MKKAFLTMAVGFCAVSAVAHPIDFDQIRHWTGTGPNRAALVVQFNGDTYGTDAYVWGYRWEDGERPTGEDMMKAICANSSRLSMLTQYTGSMGSTLCGVGYSLNQEMLSHIFFNFDKAKVFEFINFDYYNSSSFMGQTSAPGDNAPALAQAAIDEARKGSHYIQHPFDYATYGYPAYDYDCWDMDADIEGLTGSSQWEPKWLSAWYEGYWSYWCANSPSQDWMYSGSGFSGRTLSDGAVDGWSFTQFEEAMIGGMGEGVAPCEDGYIFYMPTRAVDGGVDPSKALRTIGSGPLSIPLVVKFGEASALDNVVLSLRFAGTLPSASQVLALLSSDKAFELDGDRLSIDADGDGVFNYSGFDTSASGTWTLTEYEDCVVLSILPDALPTYLLYLPEASGSAVAIPERMTRNLSDNKDTVPVFVQRGTDNVTLTYTWYRRSDDTFAQSNTSTDIITSVGTGTSNLGQLTYKGDKAGYVWLHVRVRISTEYSYSNICRFTLLPPERPIESISFAYPSVDAPLNSNISNPITYLPEDATYTALTYTSSDTKVVTASATAIKTTKTPGAATVTASSVWSPSVKASFEVVSALRHPVTDISIKDVDGDVIRLNPKQMLGIIGEITPADADIPDFDVTLADNGTNRDNYIATMYKVNYWDEANTRIQFYELSGHRAGECNLTLSSTDGSGISKTFKVIVEEQDHTPIEGGYTEGTLLLNEEWFGHTNGGMNYLTPDGEIMYQVYERENPGMSFGCTSQYAAIWADRLIAVSKQAADGGDPLPGGGRVVVADAKTLKRIGSIDDLVWGSETKSADGRAVVGATPSKVYVGSSSGIYIVELDQIKVTGKISALGSESADLYSGQIGDMVNAGRYVFGIKQSTGAFAIDVETDQVVWNFPLATVQGITQTADGHIWIASTVDGCGHFTCIDPQTLTEVTDMSVTLPATVGAPTCSWGAWRNTPFVGSHTRNTIWFSTGGGIAGGSSKDKFYGWEVGTDPALLAPVFDFGEVGLTGSHANVKQKTYGTLRYDERSGQLIVMTTEDSASGHYRYNWTHFINPETGAIERTIALRPYYWFQAFAIFPDKHDAVIDLNDISIDLADAPLEIDLADVVKDADNVDSNIRLSIAETPGLLSAPASEPHANVTLDGTHLTVKPLSAGSHTFTLAAESNGRVVSKTIPVQVSDITSGIAPAVVDGKSLTCDGRRVTLRGFSGFSVSVYDPAGHAVLTAEVDTDAYVLDFGAHSGVYILTDGAGFTSKFVIR